MRVTLSVVITVENAHTLASAVDIAQSAVESIRQNHAIDNHDEHINGVFVTSARVSTYGAQ